jgi:hypothetical protein
MLIRSPICNGIKITVARPRDRFGRFIKQRGWYINEKGYPRYSAGKHRGRYVHRVKMERKLGRKLRKDEDVHHRNKNKLDFRLRNLEVVDKDMHGWYSSKQYWFMRQKDKKEKDRWDGYFKAQAANA